MVEVCKSTSFSSSKLLGNLSTPSSVILKRRPSDERRRRSCRKLLLRIRDNHYDDGDGDGDSDGDSYVTQIVKWDPLQQRWCL